MQTVAVHNHNAGNLGREGGASPIENLSIISLLNLNSKKEKSVHWL